MGTSYITNKSIDSLKKRYFYRLTSNLVILPINFLMASIIPRSLGISAYGDFHFITDFFTKMFGLLNLGTITAFYTKLSKSLKDPSIVRFYWGFILIKFLLALAIVSFIYLLNKDQLLWVNQKPLHVWLGFLWGMFYWLNQVLNKIMDAYGLTVKAEIANVKKHIIGLIIISILFIRNDLDLTILYLFNISMFVLVLLLWHRILRKNDIDILPQKRLGIEKVKKYISEFYSYSNPLFVGGLFALFINFLDRWFIQYYYGSSAQGAYSIAFKISAICFLFTNTMMPLFTRELSIRYGEGKKKEFKKLFIRFVPLFYSIAVFLGIFFCFHSETIVFIIGGDEFSGASNLVAVMAIYPIYQTYGQMNGAIYFASERTKIYRNISIFSNTLGLLFTIMLIIPMDNIGFGLGSFGLTIKMVLLSFISTNISLWINIKYLDLSYKKMLFHQFFVLFIASLSIYGAINIVELIVNDDIFVFILSGIVYLFFLSFIVYLFPFIISSDRKEIKERLFYFLKS